MELGVELSDHCGSIKNILWLYDFMRCQNIMNTFEKKSWKWAIWKRPLKISKSLVCVKHFWHASTPLSSVGKTEQVSWIIPQNSVKKHYPLITWRTHNMKKTQGAAGRSSHLCSAACQHVRVLHHRISCTALLSCCKVSACKQPENSRACSQFAASFGKGKGSYNLVHIMKVFIFRKGQEKKLESWSISRYTEH